MRRPLGAGPGDAFDQINGIYVPRGSAAAPMAPVTAPAPVGSPRPAPSAAGPVIDLDAGLPSGISGFDVDPGSPLVVTLRQDDTVANQLPPRPAPPVPPGEPDAGTIAQNANQLNQGLAEARQKQAAPSVLERMGQYLQGDGGAKRSLRQRVKDFQANTTGDARVAADAMAPVLGIGAELGDTAMALAVPAAVAIPTLMGAANSEEQYGSAGTVVSGAGGLAGGIAGAGVGGAIGHLAQGDRNWGMRRIGGAVGGLVGAGAGTAVGGGVNTLAQSAVSAHDEGRSGFRAQIGAALDQLGYRSTADVERAAITRAQNSPAYQMVREQQALAALRERQKMVEAIYLQALAQGVG